MAEYKSRLEEILQTQRHDKRCIALLADIKNNRHIEQSRLKENCDYGFVIQVGDLGEDKDVIFGIGKLVNFANFSTDYVRLVVDGQEPVYKITETSIERFVDDDKNSIYKLKLGSRPNNVPLVDLDNTNQLRAAIESVYTDMQREKAASKKSEKGEQDVK